MLVYLKEELIDFEMITNQTLSRRNARGGGRRQVAEEPDEDLLSTGVGSNVPIR